MLEHEMYPLISLRFQKDYKIFYEIPLLNSRKKIDIVCLKKNYKKSKNPEIIAIEAKVKDRKKVLHQALTRLSVADKVYIALYENYISDNFLRCPTIEKYNIGVISVNGNASIVKKAKKSQLIIPSRKKRIIDDIMVNNIEVRFDAGD